MNMRLSLYRECCAARVGRRNKCLVLSTELITKGKLATVKIFDVAGVGHSL